MKVSKCKILQAKPDFLADAVDNFKKTLRIFGHLSIPRGYQPRAFNERIDSHLLYLCHKCLNLHTLVWKIIFRPHKIERKVPICKVPAQQFVVIQNKVFSEKLLFSTENFSVSKKEYTIKKILFLCNFIEMTINFTK